MKNRKAYAVITGASSGIGAAFAPLLAKEGYSLILAARRKDKLEEIKKRVEPYLHQDAICIVHPMDVTDPKACDRLMDMIWDVNVGIFINNAGFGDCGEFRDTDVAKEMDMIDVNVMALHYLTKRVLNKFRRQKMGYLLNVGSVAGLMPAGPYMATYYATKAYVVSLTRAIRKELEDQESRIYVGCLCPGPVDTEFNQVANAEFAMPAISAESCARYAVQKMKQRQSIIIPSLTVRLLCAVAYVVPAPILIHYISRVQLNKKLK